MPYTAASSIFFIFMFFKVFSCAAIVEDLTEDIDLDAEDIDLVTEDIDLDTNLDEINGLFGENIDLEEGGNLQFFLQNIFMGCKLQNTIWRKRK